MNLFQRRALTQRVSGVQIVGQGPAGAQMLAHPAYSGMHALPYAAHSYAPHPAVALAAQQAAAQGLPPPVPLAGVNPGGSGSTYAVQTLPTRTNRFPFPMPAATLGATSAGVSNAQAQVPTKPDRLVMSESTGPSSLTDISIGIAPQFGSLTGNFPISAFAANATDTVMNFDTAQTGQAIVLSLFNSGASTSTVLSGFFAEVAQ